MLLGLNSESILLGVTTCILFAITISSRKINKQEIVDDTPEGVIKSAIERMVQENLLIEEQKTQKNKSHSVIHKNNLFDDVHHCYLGNDNENYYNSGNNYSESSTDTFANNNIDSLMDPSYSLTPGNFFYNDD